MSECENCAVLADELDDKDMVVEDIKEIVSQGNVGVDIDHGRLDHGDCLKLLKKIRTWVAN